MDELTGIARAFEGLGHGVLQVVSDFDLMRDAQRFDAEFDLVEAMARASGRPLSMTWLQRDPGGEQWKAIRQRVDRAAAQGLALGLQTAVRAIGVIIAVLATRRWPICPWSSGRPRCASRHARPASWPRRASACRVTARPFRPWWTCCSRASS
jgi:hypothetical protein